jgi:hypothetical protein
MTSDNVRKNLVVSLLRYPSHRHSLVLSHPTNSYRIYLQQSHPVFNQFRYIIDGSNVQISSRIDSSFNSNTIFRQACLRSEPLANKCPNCESANSWIDPELSMLKYPRKLCVDRKFSSCIPPIVGLIQPQHFHL